MPALPEPTVLVVDDDFSFLEVVVMLLESEGLAVLEASDGYEALERLRAHPHVALVVTDYMMPRVNGVELCRHMAADSSLRSIPVILMSATFDRHDDLPPQIVAVFGKPMLFDTLLAKVRDLMRAPQAPRP